LAVQKSNKELWTGVTTAPFACERIPRSIDKTESDYTQRSMRWWKAMVMMMITRDREMSFVMSVVATGQNSETSKEREGG